MSAFPKHLVMIWLQLATWEDKRNSTDWLTEHRPRMMFLQLPEFHNLHMCCTIENITQISCNGDEHSKYSPMYVSAIRKDTINRVWKMTYSILKLIYTWLQPWSMHMEGTALRTARLWRSLDHGQSLDAGGGGEEEGGNWLSTTTHCVKLAHWKAKDDNSKNRWARTSCLFYGELDKVLGQTNPTEEDVWDTADDSTKSETLFRC